MATKKTSAATKPAGTKALAAKAAKPMQVDAEGGEAMVAEAPGAEAGAAKSPSLKIKDLVDRVVSASGGKKKDVKLVVEATLRVLGDAMSAGEDMNLPGLGRTRVARSAERDGAAHLVLKVRRGPHRPKHAEEPLAEDGEDS